MKKSPAKAAQGRDSDTMLPEYDLAHSRPNPFAKDFEPDTMAVVLDRDVAAAFPTAAAVNHALRSLVKRGKSRRGAKSRTRGGRRR